jgi:predicted Ser/Thr protein kinase
MKEINEITEAELLQIWSLIGGSPHLYEVGREDLRTLLVDGENNGIQTDFHTMACIVDVLRARGYAGGMAFAGVVK